MAAAMFNKEKIPGRWKLEVSQAHPMETHLHRTFPENRQLSINNG
jgi:hypothetical protein